MLGGSFHAGALQISRRSARQLWETYSQAKAWKLPPSKLFNLQDDVTAWCFDRAVFHFGTSVEADIRNATDKCKDAKSANRKAEQVIRKWISEPGDTAGRFRDPLVDKL